MLDILLGKRHNYKPTDVDSLADRAKQLGFSVDEIGELARLYGLDCDKIPKIEDLPKPRVKTSKN